MSSSLDHTHLFRPICTGMIGITPEFVFSPTSSSADSAPREEDANKRLAMNADGVANWRSGEKGVRTIINAFRMAMNFLEFAVVKTKIDFLAWGELCVQMNRFCSSSAEL